MEAPSKKAIQKKQVFIVDDHPMFRHGIAETINAEHDLAVCGDAEAAPPALEAIRRLEPDLAIIDISIKGSNGIELVKSIRAEFPKMLLLVLSMHDESLYALRALRAGAHGYVMKQAARTQVMVAIRDVLNGKLYLSPEMGHHALRELVHPAKKDGASALERLTDRELEVLQLIGEGNGPREIGRKMNISPKTVESHRAHIKQKFDFSSAHELTRFAMQWVEQQARQASG
jgi:DNA-binding NarL/FixJ family response regulator